MEEVTKNQRKEFKVGDRVYAPHFGEGIVTGIDESKNSIYPIHVKWTKTVPPYHSLGDCFTPDGRYTVSSPDFEFDIVSKEDKKVDTKSENFKEGDKVWSPHFGGGVVVAIANDPEDPYPVKVHWVGAVSRSLPEDDYFTKDGEYDYTGDNPDMAIYSLEADHGKYVMADVINAYTKGRKEDSGVVDRMMEALDKKTEDAINPSHYKVEGLPEAIDIINHLMHREQYEGFLWGNIIKYAYRFGRKGDKAETAGKIAWYATQLKDLEEEKRK